MLYLLISMSILIRYLLYYSLSLIRRIHRVFCYSLIVFLHSLRMHRLFHLFISYIAVIVFVCIRCYFVLWFVTCHIILVIIIFIVSYEHRPACIRILCSRLPNGAHQILLFCTHSHFRYFRSHSFRPIFQHTPMIYAFHATDQRFIYHFFSFSFLSFYQSLHLIFIRAC
jgi:hypothetical protein